MPKLLLTTSLALIFSALSNINAWSSEVAPNEETSAPQPLKRHSGYLLLGVEAQNSGTFLKFSMYRNNRLYPNATSLNLDTVESGLWLVPVVAGEYHVTEVLAPYYNLPFRLDVRDKPSWRFHIKAGHINYVGSVVANAERSKNNVDVRWLNRFAANLEQIEREYASKLERYPLTIGVPYEDPFQELLRGKPDE